MWKREPAATENNTTALPDVVNSQTQRTERVIDKLAANIGKSVIIKGELTGSEDLLVEGNVEGKINLKDHILTVGLNGRVNAEINAKAVIVQGQVIGNVIASERVVIRENGSVDGDIAAPKVAIAEGALFKGKIDMQTNRPSVKAPQVLLEPSVKKDKDNA